MNGTDRPARPTNAHGHPLKPEDEGSRPWAWQAMYLMLEHLQAVGAHLDTWAPTLARLMEDDGAAMCAAEKQFHVAGFDRWRKLLDRHRQQLEDMLSAAVLMSLGDIESADDIGTLAPGWQPALFGFQGPMLVVTPASDGRPRLTVIEGERFDSTGFGLYGGTTDL